ncbi:glycyl-tRNA synthetase [Mytilinidion resinicola]|uniref:glycine--tRNA ligase n=1 Tax=Mytilinidion resinicola TaxID=574789 RepID=A0A6A6YC00_9PEZI|nr:glycyl-tRNA synthetase [Mytilinidion resinicola]KAF2805544.1 glycyl-tRNA synthetase [Mytilinidion resinicola]
MPDTTTLTSLPFDRTPFESLLKRRVFFTESFEIYRKATNFNGDNKGLYDYGPPGCALQANIVDAWRKHFVLEEDMLELDCTMLTPEEVFKTSGHVEKFADWMCKDPITGDYLRADHLVESVLEGRLDGDRRARSLAIEKEEKAGSDSKKNKLKAKDVEAMRLDDPTKQEYEEILAKIDNYDGPELGELIKRLNIRNPNSNNPVLPPIPFNLMFKTSIGPSAAASAYLRPETAQSQFVNFRKLLEYNQNQMPFASASIGKAFRNEIAPRSGLLRVREFLLAEIEHFVDPDGGKKHEKFEEVREVELRLLDRETQLAGQTDLRIMMIGEAVKQRIVDNETLGYFLARVRLFLQKLGVSMEKLRFRQHLANEMAHYATDCWDAELLTSYGWIECVGCADRSVYDLTVHAKRTGEALVVREPLAEPLEVEEWQAMLDKKKLGPKFRKDAKTIEDAIAALSQTALESAAATLEKEEKITLRLSDSHSDITLSTDLITISQVTRLEHTREYTPNVIEPSFGIGRILYSLLEHVYWHREGDVARGVLSLPPSIAPTKVLLVPLSAQPAFLPILRTLSRKLRALGISSRIDDSSATIGKRYSRNDELGTPFGVTVDFESVKDGSVTLRERDGMRQVRSSQEGVVEAIVRLVAGLETWEDVESRLPAFGVE